MLAKLRRFICVAFILAIAPLPDGSHLLAEGVGTYQVGDAIQARLDEIAERLRADRGSAFALATLEELHDFSHWAPYGMFRDLLTEIAESDETDLLVREQAYYQLALAHFAAGDSDVAESLLRSRGYLANWSVIGPFANDGMVGFTTLYGPELERSGSAYPGKAGEVEWRDVSPYSRLGYLNVGDFCRPNHAAVSYAVTTLEVTRSSRVRLWTGANGAYKIWVNRDLVAQSPDLGGGPIREWVDIELRRGENELLIKLGNETGPMGFFLHLTDMDGDPFVVESSAVLSPIDEPVHQELSETAGGSVLGHINALFGDADLVPPEELTVSRRAAAAFLLLRNRPRDPTEPWRVHLGVAGACEDDSVDVLLCTPVLEHGWQRRDLIETMLGDLPVEDIHYPWLTLSLATLVGQSMAEDSHIETALILDRILERHPDFVPAQLLLARIYGSQGAPWAAQGLVEQALRRAPDSPEAVYQAQLSREEAGSSLDLVELYRRSVALDADKHTGYMTYVPALIRAGERLEAETVLRRALDLYPTSLVLRRVLSDLLLTNDEMALAESTLLETVEIFPGEVLAWEHLGRFYLRTGQSGPAEQAFRAALAVEPQNRNLILILARLGEEDVFYGDYVLSASELRALDVPAEMLEDQEMLTLVDQTVIRVHPNGLAHRYVQQAFRPITRQGADALRRFSVQYTPDAQIVQIITARVLKTDGTILESYSRSDENLSQPWFGLYYDTRALHLVFDDLEAGDILEVAYTLSDVSGRNILDDYFGDFWFVQDTIPKALTRFVLIFPEDMHLSVRRPTLPHSVIEEEDSEGESLLVFELENVPHVETERNMPGFSSVADYIHVSTFETWDDVANWYWNLIEDQLVSSPEIEQTVASLVQGLDTPRERVAAIHEYVVRNTRYVGLEFGIQGYRPQRTTVSFERRFGDCKDTASLMKVMLSLAGIESYLALVRTRDNGTIEEAPASLSVFNHVITYVPELELFLDGTAGHSGLSELPQGDRGASSLIVMDGVDAQFITTPRAGVNDSELRNVMHVYLEAGTENTSSSMEMTATGQFAPGLRRRYEAGEHRLETFQRDLRDSYAGARITDLSFEGLDDITVPVKVNVLFDSAEWIRPSGDYWLIRPLGFESDLAARMAGTAERNQPIDMPFPFRRVYEQTYHLPEGWRLRDGPSDWSETSLFGSYVLSARQTGGTLTVEGVFELNSTEISPSEYPAFREFLQNVDRAVNRSLTLEQLPNG